MPTKRRTASYAPEATWMAEGSWTQPGTLPKPCHALPRPSAAAHTHLVSHHARSLLGGRQRRRGRRLLRRRRLVCRDGRPLHFHRLHALCRLLLLQRLLRRLLRLGFRRRGLVLDTPVEPEAATQRTRRGEESEKRAGQAAGGLAGHAPQHACALLLRGGGRVSTRDLIYFTARPLPAQPHPPRVPQDGREQLPLLRALARNPAQVVQRDQQRARVGLAPPAGGRLCPDPEAGQREGCRGGRGSRGECGRHGCAYGRGVGSASRCKVKAC